jgi:hypothetical protein
MATGGVSVIVRARDEQQRSLDRCSPWSPGSTGLLARLS